jgi:hypothetical protein
MRLWKSKGASFDLVFLQLENRAAEFEKIQPPNRTATATAGGNSFCISCAQVVENPVAYFSRFLEGCWAFRELPFLREEETVAQTFSTAVRRKNLRTDFSSTAPKILN